jgi:hypothetical protein
MEGARRTPDVDDWMRQQQLRAELEAEAWRRLRQDVAQLPEPAATTPIRDPHKSGSAVLKGLVRASLGVFGAYLGYVAAADSGLGEFEIWLAVLAGFAITLALSMFDPFRRLVHFLAETARWVLILAVCAGAGWILFNPPA